jgi:homoserine kinase
VQRVTVRIPASTSNLGPGFDCLGVALRIYNDVTISRDGSGERHPPIISKAADFFFKTARARRFPFSCSIKTQIPQARGLGASATIRLGVLHGLNQLSGNALDRLSIFRLCAELEGHPDNAGPASFGGFTVSRGETVQCFNVSAPLHFVLLIPALEIKTFAARKTLPAKIARTDAVENCANACVVTAAFAAQRYEGLRGAFVDHLHQPFRQKLIPFLPLVISAAEKAGALGAFLSGSGSTICALALKNQDRVAAAMKRAAGSTSVRTIITTADNRGAQILNRKSEIRN